MFFCCLFSRELVCGEEINVHDKDLLSSLEVKGMTDDFAKQILDLNREIKKIKLYLSDIRVEMLKESSENKRIPEELIICLNNKKTELKNAVEKWQAILTSVPSEAKSAIIHLEPASMSLEEVIEIFSDGKIIVWSCPVPSDITVSIQHIINIPSSCGQEYLNSILEGVGIRIVKTESENILRVEAFASQGSHIDAVVSIEDDPASFSESTNLLAVFSCKKAQSSFMKDILSNYVVGQILFSDNKLSFSCSPEIFAVAKRMFNFVQADSAALNFSCVKCINITPAHCVHLVNMIRSSRCSEVESCFALPVNERNLVLLIGGKVIVDLLTEKIKNLDKKVGSIESDEVIFKYRPKHMQKSSVEKLIESVCGIKKENIFFDDANQEFFFFGSRNSVGKIKSLLDQYDSKPKTIQIECILLETTKNRSDSLDFNYGTHKKERIPGSVFKYISEMLLPKYTDNIVEIAKHIEVFVRMGKLSTMRNTSIKSIQTITLGDMKESKMKLGTEISINTSQKKDEDTDSKFWKNTFVREEYGINLNIVGRVISEDHAIISVSSKFDTMEEVNERPEVRRRSLDIKDVVVENEKMIVLGKIDHKEISSVESSMSSLFDSSIIYWIIEKILPSFLKPKDVKDRSKEVTITIAIIPHINP